MTSNPEIIGMELCQACFRFAGDKNPEQIISALVEPSNFGSAIEIASSQEIKLQEDRDLLRYFVIRGGDRIEFARIQPDPLNPKLAYFIWGGSFLNPFDGVIGIPLAVAAVCTAFWDIGITLDNVDEFEATCMHLGLTPSNNASIQLLISTMNQLHIDRWKLDASPFYL